MTFHSVGNVIIPTDEINPSYFSEGWVNHQPDTVTLGDISIYIYNYITIVSIGIGIPPVSVAT